jgi:hypothetical protein
MDSSMEAVHYLAGARCVSCLSRSRLLTPRLRARAGWILPPSAIRVLHVGLSEAFDCVVLCPAAAFVQWRSRIEKRRDPEFRFCSIVQPASNSRLHARNGVTIQRHSVAKDEVRQHHLALVRLKIVGLLAVRLCRIGMRICTAQHSTAQHSTAQHSTAQHSTAQHSTLVSTM